MSGRIRRTSLALALFCVGLPPLSAAPFQASVRRVRELARTAPGAQVTVRGVVTRYRSGRSLALEEESGRIFAHTDDVEFMAWVLREEGGAVAAIPAGSRVRLTGVSSRTAPASGPPGFELLMRSRGDLVVAKPPAWWTTRNVGAVASALGGTVALLFTDVLRLRRQVARQTC